MANQYKSFYLSDLKALRGMDDQNCQTLRRRLQTMRRLQADDDIEEDPGRRGNWPGARSGASAAWPEKGKGA